MRIWLVAVAALVSAACSCDRGTALSGRFAELVVVSGTEAQGQLSRDAKVTIAPAAMGDRSSGEFRVRNIGDTKLTLTRVALASGSTAFTVELPERTQLAPSEEVVFVVAFAPEQAADATIATVPHVAVFTIDSTGGREGETTATVTVEAVAEARDCFVPALLDFGEAPIGQAVQIPISLDNATSSDALSTLGAVGGANPGFFSVDPVGPEVTVVAKSQAAAVVRFQAQTMDAVEATLTVRRRASCPAGTVRLVGRGSMQSLSWSPAMLDFGRLPLQEVVSRPVTFSNRSGASLPLSVRVEGTGFSVPLATAVLGARSTIAVDVSCTPTAIGALTGTLFVDVGTTPVLPVRVPLRCSGGGPRLRASPSPLSFGDVPLLMDPVAAPQRPLPQSQQTTVTRRLRVENVGTPPPAPQDSTFNLWLGDRKSTRLNSSHNPASRMPSSA
jgi:hypothetical protein